MTHFFEIWKTPLCGVHKGLEKVVSEKRPYMNLKFFSPTKECISNRLIPQIFSIYFLENFVLKTCMYS